MPSNITAYEWPLNDSIHIAYETNDEHIHEMVLRRRGSWRDNDITSAAGGPELEDAILAGSNWSRGRTQQIAYTSGMDANGHIYELVMYQDHPWTAEDIMQQPMGAAPADGSALAAYDWKAAGTKQIVYIGRDAHIHELSAGISGPWHYTDLTAATQAPLSENSLLAAYAWEGQHTKHVVYSSGDGHIHELVASTDGSWQHSDLAELTEAPPADGEILTAFAWEGNKTRQVVYTSGNGDIYELLSGVDNKWTFSDVTSITRSPLVANTTGSAALAAFAWETGESKQIVYVDGNHNIHELQMNMQGTWTHTALTPHLHLPAASDDIIVAHEWNAEFAKHIAYLDTAENPHIHSLLFRHGGDWEHTDVTSFTGSQPIV